MSTRATREWIHDTWSPLSYVEALGDGSPDHPIDRVGAGIPTWVDLHDARRLLAYRILTAYRDNTRRYWLPAHLKMRPLEVDQRGVTRFSSLSPAEKYREYGHANLLVETARALVLGDDQQIVCPDFEDCADGTEPPPELVAAQDWLTSWAEQVGLMPKLHSMEENAVGDGDGVLVLSLDRTEPGNPRVRLDPYDPGFYFPDLASIDTTPGWTDLDYPPIVHLAWERNDPANHQITYLRRVTWRMVPLTGPARTAWDSTRVWTCLHSVTEWRTDMLRGSDTIYTLDPATGTTIQPETDLGIDFLPIIHVPNDEPGGRHFGRSVLLLIAQVLDDIAGSDTDLAITSEMVANPPVVTTGAGPDPALTTGPGATWGLASGATAEMLDTSGVLTAGQAHNRTLLKTLAVNGRLSEALIGRVDPTDVPSGLALQLGMAPTRSLVRAMRGVRTRKHALLLKFALRLAQTAGLVPAGPTPKAVIDLGAALPTDRAATIEEAKTLLAAGAISTGTAVRMLQAVGIPVEDAQAEVDAIRAESFAAAVQLVEATGDVAAARKMLGLDDPGAPTGPPAPPAPVPPVNGPMPVPPVPPVA